ncbi:unnamed protein product [Brassicogethes aeneus]|uniref:Spaetzle domain-containing protein n=1 Tax=Brassicogethes aeneus TaxID=1431903 RepID=A0A9P0AT72_BRAAE|nr:unnamed protein product [Brassicogethes aeneus]
MKCYIFNLVFLAMFVYQTSTAKRLKCLKEHRQPTQINKYEFCCKQQFCDENDVKSCKLIYPYHEYMESLNGKVSNFVYEENPIKQNDPFNVEREKRELHFDVGDSLCESEKMPEVRPFIAKNIWGQWKYIVNTTTITQSLDNIHKCKPDSPDCSPLLVDDRENYKCKEQKLLDILLTFENCKFSFDLFYISSYCDCKCLKKKKSSNHY